DVPHLPIWIAAISATGLVPVATRVPERRGDLYFARQDPSTGTSQVVVDPWDHTDVSGLELDVDPDVTPPDLWHFVYAALIVGAAADQLRQRRNRAPMGLVP